MNGVATCRSGCARHSAHIKPWIGDVASVWRQQKSLTLSLSAAASRPSRAAVDQEPPGEIREVFLFIAPFASW